MMKRVTLTAGEGESLAPAGWAEGRRVVELELYRNGEGVQATAYAADDADSGDGQAAVTWAAHDEKPAWVARWAGRCGFEDLHDSPERRIHDEAKRRVEGRGGDSATGHARFSYLDLADVTSITAMVERGEL